MILQMAPWTGVYRTWQGTWQAHKSRNKVMSPLTFWLYSSCTIMYAAAKDRTRQLCESRVQKTRENTIASGHNCNLKHWQNKSINPQPFEIIFHYSLRQEKKSCLLQKHQAGFKRNKQEQGYKQLPSFWYLHELPLLYDTCTLASSSCCHPRENRNAGHWLSKSWPNHWSQLPTPKSLVDRMRTATEGHPGPQQSLRQCNQERLSKTLATTNVTIQQRLCQNAANLVNFSVL